ncbi:MAG: hypothetical protein K5777_01350 [Nitrosopumilus sp.]|nr:hypothetical protein [Nitrosopumilus sp.]
MVKSLGDYNKEQSSSSDRNNIKWTQKNPTNNEKPKKKNKQKISPLNTIQIQKNEKVKVERVFIIEEDSEGEKSKNNLTDKKFQKSSASNCKIERGFKRPGR